MRTLEGVGTLLQLSGLVARLAKLVRIRSLTPLFSLCRPRPLPGKLYARWDGIA